MPLVLQHAVANLFALQSTVPRGPDCCLQVLASQLGSQAWATAVVHKYILYLYLYLYSGNQIRDATFHFELYYDRFQGAHVARACAACGSGFMGVRCVHSWMPSRFGVIHYECELRLTVCLPRQQ